MEIKALFVPAITYPSLLVKIEPGLTCSISTIPLMHINPNTFQYVIKFFGEYLDQDIPALVNRIMDEAIDIGFVATNIGLRPGDELVLDFAYEGGGLVIISIKVPQEIYDASLDALRSQLPEHRFQLALDGAPLH